MIGITKKRNLWWALSGTAIVASDCSVAGNCDSPIDTAQVREVLDAQELGKSTIQLLGDDKQILSVRTENLDGDRRSELLSSISEAIGAFDSKTVQIDSVGPTIGEELFVSGILALLVAFAGIIAYLSIRFQFDYALFAIAALFHDVVITAGVFSLLGLTIGLEADSLFLVALLTIIGFSVNDTVVIYDRIRENLVASPEKTINEVVDSAVNQTLGRSINTTLTTLLPLIGIFLFGGQTLKFFALALIVGFTLGAYSSIFIASTLLAWWRNKQGKQPIAVSDVAASE